MNNLGKVDLTTVHSTDWTVEQALRSTSQNGRIALTVGVTTKALKSDGSRVELITIEPVPDPPTLPVGNVTIGDVVDLGPEGATFDPPLVMAMSYTNEELPSDASGQDLYIARWDGAEWVPLESSVDPAANTVSTQLSHFSTYAIIAPASSGLFPLAWWVWSVLAAVLLALMLISFAIAKLFIVAARRRRKIVFATPSQRVSTGAVSELITVQVQDHRNKPRNVSEDTSISLASSSPSGRFDTSQSGTFDVTVTSVTIQKGRTSASFYYRDSDAGIPDITAEARWPWLKSGVTKAKSTTSYRINIL